LNHYGAVYKYDYLVVLYVKIPHYYMILSVSQDPFTICLNNKYIDKQK